jgi:hypothetical protein
MRRFHLFFGLSVLFPQSRRIWLVDCITAFNVFVLIFIWVGCKNLPRLPLQQHLEMRPPIHR